MIVSWFNDSNIPCKTILVPFKYTKENINIIKSLSKILYKKPFTKIEIK